MTHNKQTVTESFLKGIDMPELDNHRKNLVKVIKILILLQGTFSINDVHDYLKKYFNHTGNYTSYLNIIVEHCYLNKEDGIFSPTPLLREFLSIN